MKTWNDRMVVAGRTFKYSESGQTVSLLPEGKTVFIAPSRSGACPPHSPMAQFEHHETYLKSVPGFSDLMT